MSGNAMVDTFKFDNCNNSKKNTCYKQGNLYTHAKSIFNASVRALLLVDLPVFRDYKNSELLNLASSLMALLQNILVGT